MNRTRLIGVASAAALAIGLIGAAAAPAAAAPAAATGPETGYLVLAPQGKSIAKAAARVAAAGGTVVASYEQIGVLVVRSTNTAFSTAVAGAGVESVASTEGLGTTLVDDDEAVAVDASAVEVAGDPTGEQLWGLQWDMMQIDVAEAHEITTGDPSVVWEGHKTGADVAYCQIEKLQHLDEIPSHGFTVACFPAKVRGASAGWTRAVAILED